MLKKFNEKFDEYMKQFGKIAEDAGPKDSIPEPKIAAPKEAEPVKKPECNCTVKKDDQNKDAKEKEVKSKIKLEAEKIEDKVYEKALKELKGLSEYDSIMLIYQWVKNGTISAITFRKLISLNDTWHK